MLLADVGLTGIAEHRSPVSVICYRYLGRQFQYSNSNPLPVPVRAIPVQRDVKPSALEVIKTGMKDEMSCRRDLGQSAARHVHLFRDIAHTELHSKPSGLELVKPASRLFPKQDFPAGHQVPRPVQLVQYPMIEHAPIVRRPP